tara:strand:- start:1145 stop:1399 length:255 start_codon:yes stop_codon:yes gene_type:complete
MIMRIQFLLDTPRSRVRDPPGPLLKIDIFKKYQLLIKMIEYNQFNKGKGKMNNGRRVNKKSKKLNKEIYNKKHVRKVISSLKKY